MSLRGYYRMPSITVERLKEQLSLLQAKKNFPVEGLLGEVNQIYCNEQLVYLTDVLESHSGLELSLVLKEYLAKNWNLVKGTSLSYTALPQDEFTFLLCEIAQFVTEQIEHKDKGVFAINYLMPGVYIESIAEEKYPHLEVDDAHTLKKILASHILGREGKYLIPVKQYAELAEQNDKPKQWINYYFAIEDHQEEYALLNPEEYNRLARHSSASEALMDAVADYQLTLQQGGGLLIQLKRLCRLLQINSVDGIGEEESAGNGAYEAIFQFNEYYTRLIGYELALVTVMQGTELDLQSISQEYGGIPILINRDGNISVYGLTEQGWQETDLDRKVFRDINFPVEGVNVLQRNDVQRKIRKEIREKKAHLRLDIVIPDGVSQAIERLLELSSVRDPANNTQSNMETCIATLRKDLENEMKPVELALAKIGLSKKSEEKLNGEKFEQVKICREALSHKFSDGYDKFVLTPDLLNKFKVDFFISSLNDVNALMQLTPQEIAVFCQKEDVQKQLAEQFELEDLVLFIYETSPEKLSVLLSLCGKAIVDKHFVGVKDFTALFIALDSERMQVVCQNEFMKNKLLQVTKDTSRLGALLEHLEFEQCKLVCEVIKNKLPQLISNDSQLKDTLQYLTGDQCRLVCEMIKDRLLEFSQNCSSLGAALKSLNPGQRAAVFEVIGDELPGFIQNVSDISIIFPLLTLEQKSKLYESIKDNLAKFIGDDSDFLRLSKCFGFKQCMAIDGIKERLPELFNNHFDLQKMLENFDVEQCTIFCEAIKNKLPDIIGRGAHFGFLIQPRPRFTPEKCTAVYEVMKDMLPQLMEQGLDLKWALKYLSPEQCKAVCDSVSEQLPRLIDDIDGLLELIKELSEEQNIAICGSLSSLLNTHLIDVEKNFPRICERFVTEEGKQAFQHHYLKRILEDIKCHGDLKNPKFAALYGKLTAACENYFNGQMGYDNFKTCCDSATQQAHTYLRDEKYLSHLIGKCFLAIATLGTAVVASTIYTGMKTGDWTCRFFEVPEEENINKLQCVTSKLTLG